jgi:hypothetical protein
MFNKFMSRPVLLWLALLVTGVIGLTSQKAASFPQACVPPPSGLVAWFPGDGNANDIVAGIFQALDRTAQTSAALQSPECSQPVRLLAASSQSSSSAGSVKLFAVSAQFAQSTNEVFRYDIGSTGSPTLDLVITDSSFDGPGLLAFGPKGEMFVINRGPQTFSGPQGSVTRFLNPQATPIPNGTITSSSFNRPHWAIFRNSELFIANPGDNNVLRFVFDGTGNAIPNGTITAGLFGTTARGIQVTPWGELFVTQCCGVDSINRYIFDSSGNAIPNGVITGGLSNPHDMAFSPRGELFVANFENNTVSRFLFDAEKNAIFNGQFTASTFNGPLGLAFGPGGELFVGNHLGPGISHFLFDASFNPIPNGFISTPASLADIEFSPQITDNIPPTFTSVPQDLNLFTGAGATDCTKFISDASLGTATAIDNFPGQVLITSSGIPSGNLFPVGETIITYMATDAAGNTATATATQKVTVIDNTMPTITAPPDVNLGTGPGATSCSKIINDEDLGTATANDNCPNFMLSRSAIPLGNIFPLGDTFITYTITDNSGNTASDTQKVTVTDTTPPLISAPANAEYQCLSEVPAANSGNATATDNCSTPSVTVSESNNGGTGSSISPLIITRTFTATDTAGISASATQTITVIDTIAPTITAPPNVTKTVNSAPVFLSAAELGSPTASDNCAVASITSNAPATFPAGTTTVTYTATDFVGNSSTATQQVTIIVQNNQPMATINVQASLHTVGNGGTKKTPLSLNLKVFDTAKLGSFSPKEYGTIWLSGTGLTAPTVSISTPAVVSVGGGQANLYNLTVPSNDPSNASVASGSYLVIGQAVVNGITVFTGRQTDSLATGSITDMFLQLILTPNGKIAPGVITAIPGSLLLITEPEYLEFTSNEEMLPIIYESVEGEWSSVVQADVPAGYVSNPGAQQANVSTSQIQVLEFTVKDTGNQLSAIKVVNASSRDEKSAKVVHHLKHKGREITVTTNVRVISKK